MQTLQKIVQLLKIGLQIIQYVQKVLGIFMSCLAVCKDMISVTYSREQD